jgi:hypothetical protein
MYRVRLQSMLVRREVLACAERLLVCGSQPACLDTRNAQLV